MDELGHSEQIKVEEAERRLESFNFAEDPVAHRLWPDGAVDLFSELVCLNGWIVEARYEGSAQWRRLSSGFKEQSLEVTGVVDYPEGPNAEPTAKTERLATTDSRVGNKRAPLLGALPELTEAEHRRYRQVWLHIRSRIRNGVGLAKIARDSSDTLKGYRAADRNTIAKVRDYGLAGYLDADPE
jgi:hypothetical protein